MTNGWKAREHQDNKAIVWQWAWSMHQPKEDDLVMLNDIEDVRDIRLVYFLGYKWFFLKVWVVMWELDQDEILGDQVA